MRVYEPTMVEGYQWVQPVDDRDFEVFRSLSAELEAARWRPIRVRILKADADGRPFQEADLPWLGSHALVFGKRAVEVLGKLVASDAEFLPLACDEAELWLVHVWRVIDALDRERSLVVRFSSTGRIMKVKRPVFDTARLDNVRCFKVPEFLRGPTYVTDVVVSAAETAGLTGVRFRLVADS